MKKSQMMQQPVTRVDLLSTKALQRLKDWYATLQATVPETFGPFDEALYDSICGLLQIPRLWEDTMF